MSIERSVPTDLLVETAYMLTTADQTFMARSNALREPYESTADYAIRLNDECTLPPGLATVVEGFLRGEGSGGLLLRGFDVDGFDPVRAHAVGERILLSVATHIGMPYGYSSQRGGDIVQNLTPKKEDAHKQVGTGSATMLEWHTEDAHAKFNCDTIALFCLRGAKDATTFISKVNPETLDKTMREQLEQPDFIIHSDNSYACNSGLRTPVLSYGKDSDLQVRFDPQYTECPNPDAGTALRQLEKHINDGAESVTLRKGDLLLIDNRSSVHARSPFDPKYDGRDRWLQRVGIFRKDVPASMLAPDKKLVINL